jgi:predicted Na+-dependent transporter
MKRAGAGLSASAESARPGLFRVGWVRMLTAKERLIACWLLAVAIVTGFLVPGLSEKFSSFTSVSLFMLIILSLLPMGRMEPEDVFSLDKKVWQIVIWQLIVLPAIIVSAAYLAKIDSTITILMVTTASAGSLFASPTFAELLQVNKQKALQCMVLSTFLMPASYFLFFTVVLHAEVSLDVGSFAYRCMIFLVLPLAIFLIYFGIASELPKRLTETVEGASRRLTILVLIAFGLGILGPARDLLWSNPERFALYLAIVTILGAGMAYLTAVVMFQQGMNDALTASIVSGFRNVGLGFVLLSGMSTSATDEYVGISQIPVFLAPLILHFVVRSRREQLQPATA